MSSTSHNLPVTISDAPRDERDNLVFILEESFEGWYLRHSKRTLYDIPVVRQAKNNDKPAGLVMLKDLGRNLGYVYYIAVAREFRGKGIAGRLLDDSLAYFFNQGMHEVYSSVEEDNEDSKRLFESRHFKKTDRGELAKKYGTLNSFVLLRKMVIVPGEMILFRELTPKIDSNVPKEEKVTEPA